MRGTLEHILASIALPWCVLPHTCERNLSLKNLGNLLREFLNTNSRTTVVYQSQYSIVWEFYALPHYENNDCYRQTVTKEIGPHFAPIDVRCIKSAHVELTEPNSPLSHLWVFGDRFNWPRPSVIHWSENFNYPSEFLAGGRWREPEVAPVFSKLSSSNRRECHAH